MTEVISATNVNLEKCTSDIIKRLQTLHGQAGDYVISQDLIRDNEPWNFVTERCMIKLETG